MDHSHEPDEWQRRVGASFEEQLPPPPARVLDVGCGDGWLVRSLVERGYDAHGVDPEAPDGEPRLTRARFEDLEPDRPFDAVIAMVSLHHVEDLDLVVARIAELTEPDGLVLCAEFAWERFDDATAAWCLERLPDELEGHNWLHERCRPLRERQRAGEELRAGELMRSWAAEHGFHSAARILGRLREELVEDSVEWGPYLYPELGTDPDEERAAIARGEIAPMSFLFRGRPRRPARPGTTSPASPA